MLLNINEKEKQVLHNYFKYCFETMGKELKQMSYDIYVHSKYVEYMRDRELTVDNKYLSLDLTLINKYMHEKLHNTKEKFASFEDYLAKHFSEKLQIVSYESFLDGLFYDEDYMKGMILKTPELIEDYEAVIEYENERKDDLEI